MELTCRNLGFRYQGAEHPVFQGIDLSLTEPGFNALFGPSGVGKTTLAKILMGAMGGYLGQLALTDLSPCLYAYNLERLPGCRPWAAISTGSARRNGGRCSRSSSPSSAWKNASRPDSPSCPWVKKNRASLIRYLLQDFQMLIMDESLANVDEATRRRIILRIKEIFADRLFLYISHNLMEVATFCKEVVVFCGADKKAGAVTLAGCDLATGHVLGTGELNQTMLEIVNAA